MDRNIVWKISGAESGSLVGDFLRAHGFSRRILIDLKGSPGSVTANGTPAYLSHSLAAGDTLCVRVPEEKNSPGVVPVFHPLRIVYEDEDLLVIDKEAEQAVHPSIGHREDTLANAAAYYFRRENSPFVFRCINRLDRDTTGLLILAKNKLSGTILYGQMRRRQIARTYLAVAEGVTAPSGVISLPIGRALDSIIRRRVDPLCGETAVTHFSRLAWRELAPDQALRHGHSEYLSLLELRLDTGRTHQIRVHMAAAGHPLAGDSLYNPGPQIAERQALHSWKLDFPHPITGCPLSFCVPPPADFTKLFSI